MPDGGAFSVDAETLRDCDRLLVQPYFDSSFQFYLPFTLDKARSVTYSNQARGGKTRLAPFLVALVGEGRLAVPAVCRCATLPDSWVGAWMRKQWRAGGPQATQGDSGAVCGGYRCETTWGYLDGDILFRIPGRANSMSPNCGSAPAGHPGRCRGFWRTCVKTACAR